METRTATIHTRIQPSLKLQAERIFAAEGHTASEVLEQFYSQTVQRGKVPIRLTKWRVPILDENIMDRDEIRRMLGEAKVVAREQIRSGKYITAAEIIVGIKERCAKKV